MLQLQVLCRLCTHLNNSDLSDINTSLTTTTGSFTGADSNIVVHRANLRKNGAVVNVDGSIACKITLGNYTWSTVAFIPEAFRPKALLWAFYYANLSSVHYGFVEFNKNGNVRVLPLIGNLNANTQIHFQATWIQ